RSRTSLTLLHAWVWTRLPRRAAAASADPTSTCSRSRHRSITTSACSCSDPRPVSISPFNVRWATPATTDVRRNGGNLARVRFPPPPFGERAGRVSRAVPVSRCCANQFGDHGLEGRGDRGMAAAAYFEEVRRRYVLREPASFGHGHEAVVITVTNDHGHIYIGDAETPRPRPRGIVIEPSPNPRRY